MNRQAVLLTLALVLLAVFTTAFAMINYNNAVKVWPLMSFQPLTLVIGVSFALGTGVGVLLVSLLHHRRALATHPAALTVNATPTVSEPMRERISRF